MKITPQRAREILADWERQQIPVALTIGFSKLFTTTTVGKLKKPDSPGEEFSHLVGEINSTSIKPSNFELITEVDSLKCRQIIMQHLRDKTELDWLFVAVSVSKMGRLDLEHLSAPSQFIH